nr:molybdopterin-binding protein [Mailhella massiliensis]
MSRISMQTIPVSRAVGTVLCHDITRIEPGGRKGPVFRKGHIVREEDIPVLLSVGKEHLYVYTPLPGQLHENEAATRIGNAVAGRNIAFSDIREGRINFLSTVHGLLRVDVPSLCAVNSCDEIVLATLHTMQEVQKGQAVGGTRVIPLLIEEEKIQHLEGLVTSPVLEVLPFRPFRVGIVTTGNEVYTGRIKDAFGPVLKKKFEGLGSSILGQAFSDDSVEMTAGAIRRFIEQGADMVVCTGGMSVDPDDRTPSAIRAAGGEVITYGAPTFPGAMFLLSYINHIPVLGLPGCVMYYRASIFDLVVPRILAGVPVTREDIVALGHGGFCSGCAECRYPACAFGKN